MRLVESNTESYLRQTYDSKSFKPKLININLDCYFIDKLFYKMVIHKLIALLRKDTFLSYFLNIKKPNQIVLWRQRNNTFNLYIYTIHFSNSFSLFFIAHALYSDPSSLSPMVIRFPCGICSKAVANNHQAIKCASTIYGFILNAIK